MAEQLLDGAKVDAGAEKVGGEAVAQGARRRRVGKAQQGAQHPHLALRDGRMERAAAGRDEERARPVERAEVRSVGTEGVRTHTTSVSTDHYNKKQLNNQTRKQH